MRTLIGRSRVECATRRLIIAGAGGGSPSPTSRFTAASARSGGNCWAVVDANIVRVFGWIAGETHDQQVKARHHGSSSGGRHVASVQVHPQFWVTATPYGAVFLRRSHAKGSDALGAHKTDGRTTERV